MAFQDEPGVIKWKMHFQSPPEKVYEFISTDEGRSTFWAERTKEKDGVIVFHILNQPIYIEGKVLESHPPIRYCIEYFGSKVKFELNPDDQRGTDLTLTATEVSEKWRMEMTAGWITVLMSLKAAVDFGVDLRNHDPQRTWDQGYADD